MRIQALPLSDANARPKPNGDDAPAPAMNAPDSFIQTGPPIIYTYGTIGPSAAEPQAADR